MTDIEVIIPLVHLNGTSGNDLYAELYESLQAIDAAIDALRRGAPNARDYYPLGSSIFEKAKAGHFYRIERLTDVRAELQVILEGLADQL